MLWSSDPLVISQILAWLRSAPAAVGSGSQGLGKLATARGDVSQGMHRAPFGSSPVRWGGEKYPQHPASQMLSRILIYEASCLLTYAYALCIRSAMHYSSCRILQACRSCNAYVSRQDPDNCPIHVALWCGMHVILY